MATVGRLANPKESGNIVAVNKFEGLHLEAPTRDIVEVGSNDGDTDAVTKEEEWVKKKKTELTTTRQIETRVKRQVVLEDGKVVEDSGPIVSTNTTEDTEKQESETTERRNLGDNKDEVDGPNSTAIDAIEFLNTEGVLTTINKKNNNDRTISNKNENNKMVHSVVARPDGLVRQTREKKVVSREEIDEVMETEDVQHFGDFSDETYVKAVNSGAENIETVLLSPDSKKQLVPIGPRVVHQSSKSKKTVDTEDTDLKCIAQPDGTLVTEKVITTEHDVLIDEDLPEADDKSTGSREKIEHTESSQKFHKQRDEQKVDFVANGKIIGTEMRYAAENEQMERDGPTENPSDWDSLSDRVRKARRVQKTILQQQQQRADAALGDRKDALTKRPLDFDKEEETRKSETSRWLDCHFGSESRSSTDSADIEAGVVEPTKKTYFNVTIKSNANTPTPTSLTPPPQQQHQNSATRNADPMKMSSPPKVFIPDRESPSHQKFNNSSNKFYQGIQNWEDRGDSTTPPKFPSKTFQDELTRTLERKHNIASKQTSLPIITKPIAEKPMMTRRDEISYQISGRNALRRHSPDDSEEDSRFVRIPKEDPGYMSGSRNDLRYNRRDSREELDRSANNNSNTIKRNNNDSHLRREDSGYVKDSHEDVRYNRNGRTDSFGRADQIQRDDSAYISSSTYLTSSAPRSPKHVRSSSARTPDSGIRSPTPTDLSNNVEDNRPVAPARKRATERKSKMAAMESDYIISEIEPRPDYDSPPRSRSESPVHQKQNGKTTTTKKQTRFDEASQLKQQSTKSNKVGSVIGNSIRKLVGKIRSASAERKLKKTNKNRSPSPQKSIQSQSTNGNLNQTNSKATHSNDSTYQQYNIIDGHIGQQPTHSKQMNNNNNESRETSVCESDFRRERSFDRRGSSDIDLMNPNNKMEKQRYYLGEDPYSGSIYGKENKYDASRMQKNMRRYNNNNHNSSDKTADDPDVYISSRILNGSSPSQQHYQRQYNSPTTINSSTLGRYSKSTNRLSSSGAPPTNHSNYQYTNNDRENNYRDVQTLPRKLNDHRRPSQSTINVSIVNSVHQQQQQNNKYIQSQNTSGPAKPARTYKQSLNRSKSFNVHGLNGTQDPSPIYLSKLSKNYANSAAYKSNPHLNQSGPSQLKSPSIVNLVSRSQKDLTKIDDDPRRFNFNDTRYFNGGVNNFDNKKQVFLKGLQDQAPELYKTLHGEQELNKKYQLDKNGNYHNSRLIERESSLGSRSPITINKDTASIIRRGSSSTDDYNETYKYTTKSEDPNRPSVTNTVQNFSKKTVPSKDGGVKEIIESNETKTVTTSRYRGEPMPNLRYNDMLENRKYGGGQSQVRPVVIELRNNSRRN